MRMRIPICTKTSNNSQLASHHSNTPSKLTSPNIIPLQFKEQKNDEFICKIAKTLKEISQLIELGFEYVCEQDGLKFFRKRK